MRPQSSMFRLSNRGVRTARSLQPVARAITSQYEHGLLFSKLFLSLLIYLLAGLAPATVCADESIAAPPQPEVKMDEDFTDQGNKATGFDQLAPADVVVAEQASPQAVVISWEDTASSVHGSSLSVRLRNTSGEDLMLAPKLIVIGPYGDVVERPLGRRKLKAGSSQLLRMPVKDLPIQTLDQPTAAQILTTYTSHQPANPLGAGVEPDDTTLVAFSPVRYITFDADMRAATVRTMEAQGKINTAQSTSTEHPIQLMLDSPGDTVRPADAISGGGAPAVQGFVILPPGAGGLHAPQ